MKPDPFSRGTDVFLQSWKNLKDYAFPSFYLIGRCSEEIAVRNGSNNFSNSRITRTVMVRKVAANEYSGPNPIPKSKKLNAGHRFPKYHLMEKVKG